MSEHHRKEPTMPDEKPWQMPEWKWQIFHALYPDDTREYIEKQSTVHFSRDYYASAFLDNLHAAGRLVDEKGLDHITPMLNAILIKKDKRIAELIKQIDRLKLDAQQREERVKELVDKIKLLDTYQGSLVELTDERNILQSQLDATRKRAREAIRLAQIGDKTPLFMLVKDLASNTKGE